MDTSKYVEAYRNSERDANKQFSYACLILAVLFSLVYVGYMTDLFFVSKVTKLVVGISFPILVFVLISIFVMAKLNRTIKSGFKYFLLITFTLVIATMNVLLPKHALLGWAICIFLTNHYYNPRVCKVVFFTSISLMLLCMVASMFVGEYDPQFLTGELSNQSKLITHYSTTQTWEDTPQGRWEFLVYLKSIGINRFVEAPLYYFLPRAAALVILFVLSNTLNVRTYKLFIDEIKVNSEQEKASAELNIARDIQISTLPAPFSSDEDVEILAELNAAKEVGGDFYDYMYVDDKHIAILVGDVSGKGVPAAMFMMKTITCFKNFTRPGMKPSEILKEVNKAIYEGNEKTMFVTCFLAIIDTTTGEMIFSNAGHNPPIIGINHNFRLLSTNPGFILGPMPNAFVIDETYTLQNDETITLYTDGITEAKNVDNELYGVERLLRIYNSKRYDSVVQLHHTIKDDVALFSKGAEQSDDMTFITLRFHGDKMKYKEQQFDAVKDHIPEALSFIEGFLKEQKIEDTIIKNILVVGDELISNIVKYGYDNEQGYVFIRMLFNVTRKELSLTLVDDGKAFNPFEVVHEEPINEENYKDRKEGGLGILMVRNMMSSISYDRFNGKNILTLVRKI